MAQEKEEEVTSIRDREFGVLLGKPTVDRVLPAMPIRVIYQPVERHVSMERQGDEHVYRFRIPEKFSPGFGFYPWDAYKLRDLCDEIKSPEEAFRFFNVAGVFRSQRARTRQNVLTWSEFQRWQSLIRRLRLRRPSEGFPSLGMHSLEFKDILQRNVGLSEGLFAEEESAAMIEQIWNASEETFFWLQGIPSGLIIRRDMYLSYEETKAIFSAPGADKPGSRAWQYAQATLSRRRAERASGNAEEKQKLKAEVAAMTALDAILATIYIDNLRGVEIQVCALKGCEQTFEVRRGKEYCSNYHAHLASLRKNRLKAKTKKRPTSKEGRTQ